MDAKLQRHVRTRELLAYYISSLVGAGVLIIPGIAAQIAGPASLVAWVLLSLISAPVAIAFAAMAVAVPNSGGVPSFVEQRFDSTLGRSMSILLTLTMFVGNPVMGFASAHYARDIVGYEKELVPWVAYGFMLLAVAFNLLGIKLGSRIQSFLLLFLLIGLATVIVLALPKAEVKNVTPFFSHGVASIGTAMAICFYSFLGWENVSSIAEEVEDPERSFRKAIPWAIGCVGGLYILIAWVYLAVVPEAQRIEDPAVLPPILRIAIGPNTALIGGGIALVLLILTTNSWVLGASRLVYAAARGRLLPSWFNSLSEKTGAPVNALLLLALGYGVVIGLMSNVNLSLEWLIKLANANFMLIYLGAFVAGLRIFKSQRMKICMWAAMLATVSFALFFGWTLVFAALLLGCIYLLLRYRARPLVVPSSGES